MREALKLALEALEWNMAYLPTSHDDDGTTMAIEAVAAIKEALAQPEQEEDWDAMGQKILAATARDTKRTWEDAAVRAVNKSMQQEQEPIAYLCENAVGHKYFRWKKPSSTYKPIALYTTPPAQPEQEPVGKFAKFTDGIWREVTDGSAGISLYTTPPVQPEHIAFLSGAYEIMSKHCDELMEQLRQEMKNKADQAKERNFCPRCGKRTPDLTAVHTCTPPRGLEMT